MESGTTLYPKEQYPDPPGTDNLSIALIGPDENQRRVAVDALNACQAGKISEFSSYPSSLDDLPRLLERPFDVILIELDSNSDYALELLESICAKSTATVMVYSAKLESDVLVRCMRAGAREFLTLPFTQDTITDAMVRATSRRPAARTGRKTAGRLLVFLGAKGGDGVTTLACNFAVSLAQESGQSTLLIDLDLPLGDAALNLGVVAEYSTINALQNAARLDSSFLSKLLVKHTSGVTVLAAPGKFPGFAASDEAIDRLIAVARQDFDNVVVDMGSRLDLMGTSLFKAGSTVYLVIQAGIAGLRNSNRLIAQYFATDVPKLEIVINRFDPRALSISEGEINKALTRPAQWKIPNDYAAVERMQHRATPLALEDSPISRLMRKMARSACGLPPATEQKQKSNFILKSLGQQITARIPFMNQAPSLAQTGELTEENHVSGRPGALGMITGSSVDALEPEAYPDAKTQISITPTNGKQVQGSGADTKAPIILWPEPVSITYGTALSSNQLNAKASVPGKYLYTPAAGEKLPAGTHTLTLSFIPADAASYAIVRATVTLVVKKALPVIHWLKPDPIVRGTALSSTQLNATASVPGSFAYFPAEGEILPAGERTLSVTFTPLNVAGFKTAVAAVSLTVQEAATEIAPAASASVADLPARSNGHPNSSLQVDSSPVVQAQAQTERSPGQDNSALKRATAKALVKALSTNSAVDLGSGLHLMSSAVFQDGTTVYLVMEPGNAGISDSSRLITQFFTNGDPKPEIVINRPEHGFQGAGDSKISTALARLTSPFALLSQRIKRFASTQQVFGNNGRGKQLKALGQSVWAKIFTPAKATALMQVGITAGKIEALEARTSILNHAQGVPEMSLPEGSPQLREQTVSQQSTAQVATTQAKKPNPKSKQAPRKARSKTTAKPTTHPVQKATEKSSIQAAANSSAGKKK